MTTQEWQRSIVVSTNLLILVVIVGAMYWAQAVFIPLALAMLMTLVLSPLVGLLERIRVSRVPAVILVVTLASALVVGVGWLMTRQFVDMAAELPNYSETIKAKVRSLKELAERPANGKIARLIEDVAGELRGEPRDAQLAVDNDADASTAKSAEHQDSAGRDQATPQPMVMQPISNTWLGQLPAAMGSIGEALATFALAVILTIFMLLSRENLRDRLIRLIGHGRLTATSRAFDDAVQRISRFLLMQVIVNGTYGIALAIGLLALGVEYAVLWGLMAALLRYIPYLGAWIAAVPPVLVSVVMSDGFTQPMLVVGLIIILELISNNVVEPQLYGHSMGVSAVALLAAAAFWSFLWGPVGLVLSSPLTVCLVVLGKNVPQLKFIDILLGDEPALLPHQTFYQRLLARDQDEARDIALHQASTLPPGQVFDTLIVPALSLFKRDQEHDELNERDERYILASIHEIVDELGEQLLPSAEPLEGVEPIHILACPAHGEGDELALTMLRYLLDPRRWDVRVASEDVLAAEVVEAVGSQNYPMVCIGSLAPGGLAHTRYLCKRLRSYRDDVKIIVGRWGMRLDSPLPRDPLREAGADEVERTLLDTAQRLNTQWSLLAERERQTGGAVAVEGRS